MNYSRPPSAGMHSFTLKVGHRDFPCMSGYVLEVSLGFFSGRSDKGRIHGQKKHSHVSILSPKTANPKLNPAPSRTINLRNPNPKP